MAGVFSCLRLQGIAMSAQCWRSDQGDSNLASSRPSPPQRRTFQKRSAAASRGRRASGRGSSRRWAMLSRCCRRRSPLPLPGLEAARPCTRPMACSNLGLSGPRMPAQGRGLGRWRGNPLMTPGWNRPRSSVQWNRLRPALPPIASSGPNQPQSKLKRCSGSWPLAIAIGMPTRASPPAGRQSFWPEPWCNCSRVMAPAPPARARPGSGRSRSPARRSVG